MGKNSTGIIHHFQALKIDLNALVSKFGHGSYNENITCTWSLKGAITGRVNYSLSLLGIEKYIELRYKHTDYNGITTDMHYKVYITGIPSNLGVGENLYFICPSTRKLCKILYKCYDSKYFASRKAYSNGIYYTSQKYSKKERIIYQQMELNERINEIESKSLKSHYKGMPTRTQRTLNKLENRLQKLDNSILINISKLKFFN